MATRVRLETRGLAEYLERIAQAGRDIDATAAEALQEGGELLLSGMTERVHKDTHNLEDHLDIDGPHQDGNFHYVLIGLKKGTDAETARYANAQEYGWSDKQGAKAGKSYIRDTLDHDMAKARKVMREVFKRILGI